MKSSEVIKVLTRSIEKYGDVEVFFDCPKCEMSFSPAYLVAISAHLASKLKE